MEWIIPRVRCLQTKLSGAWHSSSGSGLRGGALPRNKGPSLAGPCDGNNGNIFIAPGSTFKIAQVKKNSCAQSQPPRSRSRARMWKHSCLLCSAPEWIIPINVLVILPSWQIWINAAVGFFPSESLTVRLRLSVYQHLQKRPCVMTERLLASCTIYISPWEVSALP